MDAQATDARLDHDPIAVILRPLQRALVAHSDAVTETVELVSSLEDRLHSVLTPDHGAYARPPDPESPAQPSPVTSELDGQTDRLLSVNDRLRTILEALEV